MDHHGIEQLAVQLPVGTVTFLLTDVENSTFLWESAPEAMGAAIRRHYQLLDAAVTLHNGVRPQEQGEGDSTVAAFGYAGDALAAALDIQRAFAAECWPEGASLKLRIALHTAQAQLRDAVNYFGPAVNRCARLRAVAHGGQVVLSKTTRDLVLEDLPEGAELADLGVHRLRDLGQPEHVFGLVHADLPDKFPPLRSLGALANNLPAELTTFIGRSTELVEVSELLGQVRLLTLTGTGGCGKTRLALQAAAIAMGGQLDGVWWVELARLDSATLVPAAVIAAIGVRELPGQGPLGTLIAYLRARRALLVLDNCEHVLRACAQLAGRRWACRGKRRGGCRRCRCPVMPTGNRSRCCDTLTQCACFSTGLSRCAPIFRSPRPMRRRSRRSARSLTVSRWPSSWPLRGCG
jgi:class 3 adenylate cyclase